MQISQSAGVQLRRGIGERLAKIRSAHVVEIPVGRQTHPHAIGRPDTKNRVEDLFQKTITVFHTSPVAIRSPVAPRVEELIDQISVRRMDLDAVKAGGLGHFSRAPVVFDHNGNLRGLQCARDFIRLLPDRCVDGIAVDFDRRCRDGRVTAVETAVRGAPTMPELQKKWCAPGAEGPGDFAPSLNLLFIVDARRVHPSNPLFGNGGRLRDDQSGRGALDVVFQHEGVGNPLAAGASTRQRCHRHTVSKSQSLEIEGGQEMRRGVAWSVGFHSPAAYCPGGGRTSGGFPGSAYRFAGAWHSA